jgi:hypothetical protein
MHLRTYVHDLRGSVSCHMGSPSCPKYNVTIDTFTTLIPKTKWFWDIMGLAHSNQQSTTCLCNVSNKVQLLACLQRHWNPWSFSFQPSALLTHPSEKYLYQDLVNIAFLATTPAACCMRLNPSPTYWTSRSWKWPWLTTSETRTLLWANDWVAHANERSRLVIDWTRQVLFVAFSDCLQVIRMPIVSNTFTRMYISIAPNIMVKIMAAIWDKFHLKNVIHSCLCTQRSRRWKFNSEANLAFLNPELVSQGCSTVLHADVSLHVSMILSATSPYWISSSNIAASCTCPPSHHDTDVLRALYQTPNQVKLTAAQ